MKKLEEEAKRFMQLHNKSLITAGEVAGKVKKNIRDGTESNVASEIGDVLWYCAMLANELGVNLGKIMEKNLEKLNDRKQRGTLQGSGDTR